MDDQTTQAHIELEQAIANALVEFASKCPLHRVVRIQVLDWGPEPGSVRFEVGAVTQKIVPPVTG